MLFVHIKGFQEILLESASEQERLVSICGAEYFLSQTHYQVYDFSVLNY